MKWSLNEFKEIKTLQHPWILDKQCWPDIEGERFLYLTMIAWATLSWPTNPTVHCSQYEKYLVSNNSIQFQIYCEKWTGYRSNFHQGTACLYSSLGPMSASLVFPNPSFLLGSVSSGAPMLISSSSSWWSSSLSCSWCRANNSEEELWYSLAI